MTQPGDDSFQSDKDVARLGFAVQFVVQGLGHGTETGSSAGAASALLKMLVKSHEKPNSVMPLM